MSAPDPLVLLGVITEPRGLAGEVKIRSFTGDPQAIADYGPLWDKTRSRAFALKVVGAWKGGPVCRIQGVTGRAAAEALTGTELYAPRNALPPPGDDEFYHADLIGLAVVDFAGQVLGRITAVPDFGAGPLLEITPPEGAPWLLPFTRAAVPEVDIAAGRVVAEPPEEIGPPAAGEVP